VLQLQLPGGIKTYPRDEQGGLSLQKDLACLASHYMNTLQLEVLGPLPPEFYSSAPETDMTHVSPSLMGELHTSVRQKKWNAVSVSLDRINQLLQNMGLALPSPVRPPSTLLYELFDSLEAEYIQPHMEALNASAVRETGYGELRPILVSKILSMVHLGTDSQFVDLGCGSGGVVVQVSLETGCNAVGIEMVSKRVKIAQAVVAGFHETCRLWGLPRRRVEIFNGNLVEYSERLGLFGSADLILVNNVVYPTETNQFIFEQMKTSLRKGAVVVALAALTPENISTGSSFRLETLTYNNEAESEVSWTGKSGLCYIYTRLQ
jgi:precorrin-6B methylase 2